MKAIDWEPEVREKHGVFNLEKPTAEADLHIKAFLLT